MFKITATNNGRVTETVFPCSEIELKARLIFIGATEGYPAQVTVAKVHSRPELEILEGQICDPDELNYLAKRLESFTSLEYAQFCEGIKSGGFTEPKDLINLTFNLNKFVLIQHIPSYEAIGRSYLLNSQGGLSVGEDDSKYEQVGREIIFSGKGVFTDQGLLFVSDKPMEELYDGVSFPAYDYKGNGKYELNIAFGGRKTIMFLPAEEIAITKAITRLGARFDRECDISLVVYAIVQVAPIPNYSLCIIGYRYRLFLSFRLRISDAFCDRTTPFYREKLQVNINVIPVVHDYLINKLSVKLVLIFYSVDNIAHRLRDFCG